MAPTGTYLRRAVRAAAALPTRHASLMVTFPTLKPGDKIGVTAPSAGVDGPAAERIDFCVTWLRNAGYEVVVGDCMDGSGITSGPAGARAAELTHMLCDPSIRCVVPPWGGETAIDLLDLLDWDALAAAEPTWLVGFSDLSSCFRSPRDWGGRPCTATISRIRLTSLRLGCCGGWTSCPAPDLITSGTQA